MNGRYLAFVDNDDYVDSSMYEVLISTMRREKVFVAKCGWVEFDEKGNEISGKLRRFGKIPIRKVQREFFEDGRKVGAGYVWNGVFDYKNLVRKTGDRPRFNENLEYHEDVNFQIRAYAQTKGYIYVMKDELYHSHREKTLSDELKAVDDALSNVLLYKNYCSYANYKRAMGYYYANKINVLFRQRGNSDSDRWEIWNPVEWFLDGFKMCIFCWRFPSYYFKYALIFIGWIRKKRVFRL